MTDKPTLDEILHRALEFPSPHVRLAGLDGVRSAIEEQLVYLKDQYRVRKKAELDRLDDVHPEDLEHEEDSLSHTVDELFPKTFRGGFVVALWSVFESGVKDIAEYARKQRSLPFGLEDLRAGDFLQQMDKFFEGAMGLDVLPDKAVRRELEELRGFRNALAHHDGRVDALPQPLRDKAKKAAKDAGFTTYNDLHHNYAIPTPEYMKRSLSVVGVYLTNLEELVYTALHPKKPGAPTV